MTLQRQEARQQTEEQALHEQLDRFIAKSPAADGCWAWAGNVLWSHGHAYARFRRHGKLAYVHAALCRLAGKSLPPRHLWRRQCQTEACVNPDHWKALSLRENGRESALVRGSLTRTTCPKGHPYDEANTYVAPAGWRSCRTCRREARRRSDARLREPLRVV